MATARSVLRPLLAEAIGHGEYTALTTSGPGGAAGANLVDSDLSGRGTDFCAGWWVVLPSGASGTASYEAREISSSGGGTITPVVAFSGVVAGTVSYELYRYDPALLHLALNRGAELLYPHVNVPKRDETLVISNLLSNWDFEDYSGGAFTSWTTVGSPGIVAQSAPPWHGTYKAKITSAAGAVAQLTQSPTLKLDRFRGKTAIFGCRVFSGAADVARIGLQFKSGGTVTYSDYHDGDSTFRLLKVETTIPSAATLITAFLEMAAGTNTGHFDACYLVVENNFRYTIPSTILMGPYKLSYEDDQLHPDAPYLRADAWHLEDDSSGRYIMLDEALPAGRILRIDGRGVLSTVSTEAGTIEVNAPVTNLLIARAALWLYEGLHAEAVGQDRVTYAEEIGKWARRTDLLLSTPGMRSRSSP